MAKELEALKRLEYFVNEEMGIKTFKQSGWHIEGTDDYELVKQALQCLEILKPICEVVETPVKKFRFLKVRGVVVYEFKSIEEYELFKEWLEDE